MEMAKEKMSKLYRCRRSFYPDYKKVEKIASCTCYQGAEFEPEEHQDEGNTVYVTYPCSYYSKDYSKYPSPHVYARYSKEQNDWRYERSSTSVKCMDEDYCQICEDEKNLRLIETWKSFQMQRRVPSVHRYERELRGLHNQITFGKEKESKIDIKSNDNSFEKQRQKKKFQCLYCSKSFAKSSHLRDHHRTHSGERPFVCKYCSKAFSQFSNLRTHLRIHTGEKPFRCTICQKAFTQRVTLRSHIRTHSS